MSYIRAQRAPLPKVSATPKAEVQETVVKFVFSERAKQGRGLQVNLNDLAGGISIAYSN